MPGAETRLRTKMISRINKLGCPSRARTVHGSPNQGRGEPDIDACVRGVALKVEVKTPGNVPTPNQDAVIRKWRAAGAVAGYATTIEELDDLIAEALLQSGMTSADATWLLSAST